MNINAVLNIVLSVALAGAVYHISVLQSEHTVKEEPCENVVEPEPKPKVSDNEPSTVIGKEVMIVPEANVYSRDGNQFKVIARFPYASYERGRVLSLEKDVNGHVFYFVRVTDLLSDYYGFFRQDDVIIMYANGQAQ